MKLLHKNLFVLVLSCIMLSSVSYAQDQQINSDRPGVGVDPEVIPINTFQTEIGTDGYEYRLGTGNNIELLKDSTSFGAKYAVISNDIFEASGKLAYDDNKGLYAEIPAKYVINKYFYLGGDVILYRNSRTYVTEYAFTPDSSWTIMPSIYYDTKARAAFYVSYVLPKYQNVQLDAGWNQEPSGLFGRFEIGISVAFGLKK